MDFFVLAQTETEVIGMVLGILSDLGVMGALRAFVILMVAVGGLKYILSMRG